MASLRLRLFSSSPAPTERMNSASICRYFALVWTASSSCCSGGCIELGMLFFSQTLGQLCHEAQVMHGCQSQKKAIVDFEQVVQVADRVAAAAEAVAIGRDGAILLDDFVVIDIEILEPLLVGAGRGQAPWLREDVQTRVAGIARGHGAIEDGISHAGTFQYVGGVSHAQRVHGELRRDDFPCVPHAINVQIALAVQRPAAIAEAVEADLQ